MEEYICTTSRAARRTASVIATIHGGYVYCHLVIMPHGAEALPAFSVRDTDNAEIARIAYYR